MANYIATLRAERDELRATILAAQAAIMDFRVHLASDKFRNVEDAERRDWIATADVNRWLAAIAAEFRS